jgi:hypothetical protein
VRRLNLATQPFRNETLPAVLLALAAVLLLGLTIRHAFAIRGLMPDRLSAGHRQAAELEAEAARLRAEAGAQRVERPDAKMVTQWALLKELVDRRAFSWTGLFGVLEEALPPGVRLLTISPSVEKGTVKLDVTAATRSYEAGLEMIRVMEDRPEFADVLPLSRSDEDDARFHYRMRYLPPPPGAPRATTPAAGGPAPAADEPEEEEEEDEAAAAAAARLERLR